MKTNTAILGAEERPFENAIIWGGAAADGKGDHSIHCKLLALTTVRYTVKMKDCAQWTTPGRAPR